MEQGTQYVVHWLHRAAAVFLYEKHLLLQGEVQGTFWTLPGGRIKPLESSHEALLREMREELHTDIQIERLLWTSEEFFINEDTAQHQFSFYYLATLPAHSSLYKLERIFTVVEDDGTPILFRWFLLDQLHTITLYPTFLATSIRNLPDNAQHIIVKDNLGANKV
ncbi:DNA mismatch repair protein MutT [Reticulibacter mediterranei]|uniref:DNA mismatch repair protein MutT n=1 Tax=Reticulibacter mediterranei TaxID=2778369 RepID=A0A8J3IXW5_9CHLR|nr:NUDIX hydrolase [Reticulibacter mediterranei]GHO98071.1 DNA mismatch repair protein MutT [Reticulibacter mediterranei]